MNLNTYSGVTVVENFSLIDHLFKDKKLSLSHFSHIRTYPNMSLVIKNGKQSALAIVKKKKVVLVSSKFPNNSISGITARNKEQIMALNLLRDNDIDLVTITGCAGSGKTLMALAYAWECLKCGDKNKIVLAKNLVPVGREIGFLKGDLASKVRPWLGNFYDNFEILGVPEYEIDDLMSEERRYANRRPEKIEISPITYIQGRSISNAVIVVDEVQNLKIGVVKQILTRPAENTKIILLGDLSQIFERGVTSTNNGLLAVVNTGKTCEFIGHIDLLKSERSRLTDWASKEL